MGRSQGAAGAKTGHVDLVYAGMAAGIFHLSQMPGLSWCPWGRGQARVHPSPTALQGPAQKKAWVAARKGCLGNKAGGGGMSRDTA